MSNFSFDATAGTSQSTYRGKISGNDIHIVTFDSCEIKDVEGVKEPGKVYKNLILKFSNDSGVFEHTIWEPKPDDFVRPEPKEFTNKKGKVEKIPSPSNVESMNLLLKHAFDAINPRIAKQIDEGKKLSAPNWDELRKLVTKILEEGKGTKIAIKLIKNKSDEAIFPGFFSAISRENKVYVRNNFISVITGENNAHKLAFTAQEITKMQNEQTARPAPLNTQDNMNMGSEDLGAGDLDLDFKITL